MLVCDVSAIDKLIDMYGENLSVHYNGNKFLLYDLRDEFVDNNKECSIDTHKVSSLGITKDEQVIVSIDLHQEFSRDDTINI
jgi:hypothetical protein